MNDPIWLAKFREYDGVREIKGAQHAPEILALLDWADGKKDAKNLQGIRDDETPYCSSALCGVMEQVGIQSPRSAWARDWLKWGQSLPGAAYGAIVVFERGSGGHVGVVVGRDAAGHLLVFGANQSDMFRVSPFTTDRVLGFRWPKGHPLPTGVGLPALPLGAGGAPSTNEA